MNKSQKRAPGSVWVQYHVGRVQLNDHNGGIVETNMTTPLKDYHYRLSYDGPFYDGAAWPPDRDPDDAFRIIQQKNLLNIVLTDFDLVCFAGTLAEKDKYQSMSLHLFMTQAARDHLFSVLETSINEATVLYHYNRLTAGFMPTARSIGWARQYLNDFSDVEHFTIGRNPELSFSATGIGRKALLELAATLSPEKTPTGCNPSFDATKISWWPSVTKGLWPE